MCITRALIGQKPYLDKAIQTRKSKLLSREFFKNLLFYKTIIVSVFGCFELRKARKIIRLRLVFRTLFLTLATFPCVWIRPSKHGNHEVIVHCYMSLLCSDIILTLLRALHALAKSLI